MAFSRWQIIIKYTGTNGIYAHVPYMWQWSRLVHHTPETDSEFHTFFMLLFRMHYMHNNATYNTANTLWFRTEINRYKKCSRLECDGAWNTIQDKVHRQKGIYSCSVTFIKFAKHLPRKRNPHYTTSLPQWPSWKKQTVNQQAKKRAIH